MAALLARKGRHRQRYSMDNFRLVAGCIPYRLRENVNDITGNIETRLEVLMISSPDRNDLVFPKGGWENDETEREAACREAMEEAGVEGILDDKQLGVWEFRSKSRQNSCSTEGSCRGCMFAMRVTKEHDDWPEKSNHDRKWLSVGEAFKLCRYDWMRSAIKEFLKSSSGGREHGMLEDDAVPLSELPGQPNPPLISCHVNADMPNGSTSPINALC